MLSVIIPTFNEIKNNYLQNILENLSNFDLEIIIVDSYSSDQSVELAKRYDANIIQINTTSRAKRLNVGIENASGEFILLHHPRSLVSTDGIEYLIKHQHTLDWGAFTHIFDHQHPLLSFTSWYSNFIRGDFRQIYYLDHCIFASKKLLQKVNMFDEVDIFEDTLICKKLRNICAPKRLSFFSKTSALRFLKNGILKQIYLNQKVKLYYLFNMDHKIINKEYDNLELNSKYERD